MGKSRGLVIILGTQTLSALVLLFGHDAIVGVYTADMGVAALASTLLLYAAAFQFPGSWSIRWPTRNWTRPAPRPVACCGRWAAMPEPFGGVQYPRGMLRGEEFDSR